MNPKEDPTYVEGPQGPFLGKGETAPVDHSLSLTRAERRRLEQGRPLEEVAGRIGCKFCKSTKGTYVKMGNRFYCTTDGCKGKR